MEEPLFLVACEAEDGEEITFAAAQITGDPDLDAPILLVAGTADQAAGTDAALRAHGKKAPAFWKALPLSRIVATGQALGMWTGKHWTFRLPDGRELQR